MSLVSKTASIALVFGGLSISPAAERFEPKDFARKARFELVVNKSKVLKTGASHLTARSAIVARAHGLMPGNSDGIEITFFSRPVTAADLADVMNNDGREMKKSSYAALVLFLDNKNTVWQVNLSYVVPGTTVARTIAWKPDELQKYFSNVKLQNGRLQLTSSGSYSEPQPADDVFKLSWDINLDLPVKRTVKR